MIATAVSSGLLIYKRRATKKYNSRALKTDASNSIKDVLTSITAFIGIALTRDLNIIQFEAIDEIIISLFVFTMVYTIIRETSLVPDGCLPMPRNLNRHRKHCQKCQAFKQVHSLRMRKIGPYLIGDLHVVVDADLTVRDSGKMAYEIDERVKTNLMM